MSSDENYVEDEEALEEEFLSHTGDDLAPPDDGRDGAPVEGSSDDPQSLDEEDPLRSGDQLLVEDTQETWKDDELVGDDGTATLDGTVAAEGFAEENWPRDDEEPNSSEIRP